MAEVQRGSRSRRVTVLVGAAVAVLAALLVVAVVVRPFDKEGEKAWPLDVGGRPAGLGQTGDLAEAVTPDVDPGVYLWNDFDGWHLWFVLDDSFHAVKGTITSDDDIAKVQLTPSTTGTATSKNKVLTFDIDATTAIAGIDFEPGFYAKRFEVQLESPGGALRADMVHKGSDRTTATLPIVVEKVDKPDDGS